MSEYNIVPGDRGDDWVSLMWLRRARRIEAEEIVRHHKQLEADKRRSVTTDLGQGWARKAVYTITLRS